MKLKFSLLLLAVVATSASAIGVTVIPARPVIIVRPAYVAPRVVIPARTITAPAHGITESVPSIKSSNGVITESVPPMKAAGGAGGGKGNGGKDEKIHPTMPPTPAVIPPNTHHVHQPLPAASAASEPDRKKVDRRK